MPALPSTRSKRRKQAEDAGGKPKAVGAGRSKDLGLYHCDSCHRDLSRTLRVRCAVCPDFDLCLDCFSVGAEVAPHRRNHAYRVVESLSFPVFARDWRADEELLLLEAIERFGLGSWQRVAESVGRPAAECQAHYHAVYIDVDTFPNPKPLFDAPGPPGGAGPAGPAGPAAKGAGAEPDGSGAGDLPPCPLPSLLSQPGAPGVPATSAAANGCHAGQPERRKGQATSGAPASPESVARTPPPRASPGAPAPGSDPAPEAPWAPQTTHGAATPGPAAPPGTSLVAADVAQTGYHIKRNEFDPEYDNDAEKLIADVEPGAADVEEVRGANATLLAAYNRRLAERIRRREWLRERGAIGVRKAAALDRKRTGPERELAAGLRVFARHLEPGEAQALTEGLLVEAQLRARIQELQDLRAAGLRTFEEADLAAEAAEGADLAAGPGLGLSPTGRTLAAGASPSGRALARHLHLPLQPHGAPVPSPAAAPVPQGTLPSLPPLLSPGPFVHLPSSLGPASVPLSSGPGTPVGALALAGAIGLSTPTPGAAAPPAARAAVPGPATDRDPATASAAASAAPTAVSATGPVALDLPPPRRYTLPPPPRNQRDVGARSQAHRARTRAVPADELAVARVLRDDVAMPHAFAQLQASLQALDEGRGATGLQTWRARRGVLLDVASLPDAGPLSAEERELCAAERYLPSQYLAIKLACLRENERSGSVARAFILALPFHVDAARMVRLLDWFVERGWVVGEAAVRVARVTDPGPAAPALAGRTGGALGGPGARAPNGAATAATPPLS